ncbi:MAG: bifunctional riboflavin kinase/FAD synthetase [Deltaproteobacteria bacterium]|jgi:riboflavin kinase/FMN adenylyltransferase|nr:bifunctional riboflavin kinase/FAD synthetase [Deltaproteobacteria bacterium]
MITVHSSAEARPFVPEGSIVTIGNFDGLHMGHRRLLERARQKAEERRIPCAVVSFWPHPLRVLAAAHAPPLLISREQRLRLFLSQGVDVCLELPFTPALAALSPEEFTRAALVPLNTRELVVGYDFSLGKNRSGNAAVLAALGRQYGFALEKLEPVIVGDAVVSSTRVRDLLRAGRVWEARTLLGRFHSIAGTVIHGRAVGAAIGFPTANLAVPENVLPKDGVYACRMRIEDAVRPAVTNVGVKPTFGTHERTVESFLLDIELDMYGKHVELAFIQRLRDEQRFNSPEELRLRIAQDVELARAVLAAPETRL